jgi:Adenylate and Guanylate cyclase catalytic domain
VIHDETGIYGDGINIAARLEALADPGGVLVSNTVHDQVRGKLPFTFEDVGERTVKNIEQPVRMYRLRVPGASAGHARQAPHRREPEALDRVGSGGLPGYPRGGRGLVDQDARLSRSASG